MSASEDLKAARKLIEEPECWTQGSMARDAAGNALGFRSPDAVCYCALGALDSVIREQHPSERFVKARMLLEQVCGEYVESVNDSPNTTHADVLAMFDRAIALAESAAGKSCVPAKPNPGK